MTFVIPAYGVFADQSSGLFPEISREGIGGEVAEASEEIIRETRKELDIGVIDKPFFRKESFTKYRFPQLKEWCPGHLWAPSCYHKTFKRSFIKNASRSVGHGWEMVEKCISGQRGTRKQVLYEGKGEKREGR